MVIYVGATYSLVTGGHRRDTFLMLASMLIHPHKRRTIPQCHHKHYKPLPMNHNDLSSKYAVKTYMIDVLTDKGIIGKGLLKSNYKFPLRRCTQRCIEKIP